MKRFLFLIPVLLVPILALGGAALAAELVWVGDDREVFDLADLRNGETRVFGAGEHRLTAVRDGRVVQLEREADDDRVGFSCNLDTDQCHVTTGSDEGRVIVTVERSLEVNCRPGEDCSHDVLAIADNLPADGDSIVVTKIVKCEGDVESCAEENVEIIVGDGHHQMVELTSGRSDVLLRCPKGDAMLHVQPEEAGETFLCPKHSVPLEKLGGKQGARRKVFVHRESVDK